ncbi:efflux RND transporter periplasmic adaptor subunit [Lentiprolixibacter aurantiacus]|uniref:Efflux RND transporter periplasmic adaptor subunit n=1 Tax=Lentiprolixibacter aurantiacus TaxID=2993939 RepID=A0AAE3SP76_9FLAO|nr:efflux RND transporter periplasmic adaptor subunit [Lentiprolixibacter aurantiacus]MCX2720315.1 efflux RND transporter periplasmic adaptor subunit [Lentiprolixibacter aurantiacus]
MKLRNAIVGLLTLGFIVSCGDSNTEKELAKTSPIPVTVSEVGSDSGAASFYASGSLEAVQNTSISTRMMGFVRRLNVKPGDKVRQGALLIEISNADLSAKKAQARANILSAEAAFANAEKDYNRFKALYESQSATQKEMDDISARYRMTKAGLEAARQMEQEVLAQMDYAKIKAPFDGVVTNTFIKEGDMANPGMPLLGLEAPDQFQVVAMVSESDIDRISKDVGVQVHLKSLDKWVTGKVSEVSTSSRNTGGQFLVKVVLEENHPGVRSGMYATVQFPQGREATSEKVMIPSSILVNKGQLTGVYILSDQDIALLRWIRTGRTIGDSVTVLSGLKPGERLVLTAEGKLYNGAKVTIQ